MVSVALKWLGEVAGDELRAGGRIEMMWNMPQPMKLPAWSTIGVGTSACEVHVDTGEQGRVVAGVLLADIRPEVVGALDDLVPWMMSSTSLVLTLPVRSSSTRCRGWMSARRRSSRRSWSGSCIGRAVGVEGVDRSDERRCALG
jgi:hypothetical protein